MKFFYGDRLVRTSKTRFYSHAVMEGDALLSCCGSYDLAVKEKASRISRMDRAIADYRAAIAAIDSGSGFYWAKFDRKSYKAKVGFSRDEYLAAIEKCEARKKNFVIVELEAR